MRIFIITMDDPVQTKAFIKKIIDERKENIVGLAIPYGDRLKLSKGRSKLEYIFSLLLIMGLLHFSKNSLISIAHKLKKILHKYKMLKDPTIAGYAQKMGIPAFKITSPNNKDFLTILKKHQPDIIINQSQSILKKELLQIPKIGVINRHNALLPKNRGRLTPFWVLYKGEKETGVSIHFVEEKLDAGDIIVQEKFQIKKNETFNSLVKKNYHIAPSAMLSAIHLLENGFKNFLSNDDKDATYNTTPTLKEAFAFRIKMIKRKFSFKN